ncbi:MAG: hypothetical protein JWN41_986, partial [Thermoleophilia bacterium]|nr:hypothetical protein [Thermoleophilia bacterium]
PAPGTSGFGAPAASAAPVGAAATTPVVTGIATGTSQLGAPMPGATTMPVGGTAIAPTGTGAPAAGKEAPSAATATGFGRIDKNLTQAVNVGEASFSFPSFNATAKQTAAPAISWGSGWKRVDAGNGFYYMQHANGTKAVPATEYRISATPLEKVQTIKTANGWGKKFPDGTVVVFDKDQGPYRLAPDGTKTKLPFGKQVIGGVKVRIFEAAVVRTLEPNGAVRVFDSRGTSSLGTTRGHAAAVAGGGAGAAQLTAPGKTSGVATTTAAATTPVAGGGGTDALVSKINEITGLTRQMIGQIQGGNVDATQLASITAQLTALPAGLQQAVAAGASMPAPGVLAALSAAPAAATTTTATAPATSPPATPTTTPVTGGGTSTPTTVTAPVAGVDTGDGIKQLAAGTTAKLSSPAPTAMVGKPARFGQLPEDLQNSIATAFGSNQGAKAFAADAQFSFTADGTVKVVDATREFTKHIAQIRGAGPGEDLVMTMRPVRQPQAIDPNDSPKPAPATAKAHGAASSGASAAGAGAIGASAASMAPIGTPVTAGGGAQKVSMFAAGASVTSPALAGIQGSFTWKSLPVAAQNAITAWLKANPTSAAGAVHARHTGSSWRIDPDAAIVIGSNQATFLQGLSMLPATTAAAGGATSAVGSVTGGGATAAPASGGVTGATVGAQATAPPSSGAVAPGATHPGTAPTAPPVSAGAMGGMRM